MSGRRTRELRKAFRKLQEYAPDVKKGRFRAFKRAWTRHSAFVVPEGLAFLRGQQ